jgi:hypothetical protein
MKKNVASQVVGAQMVAAADGSAFTSAVTVSVTGDGGTQATGSVGSGACTHEGNGFHTYVPAQAETNYDHVAFTFTGTGAVPATVQIYTSFPQTGDSFARIGSTGSGLTSLATQASVDTVDTGVDAVKVKTDFLPSATAGSAGGVFIAGTNAATTVTTALTTTFTGNLTGSVASVTGAVGSVTGNVGGNVTGTVGSVVGAVGSVTGNVGGNVAGSVGSVTGAVGSVTGLTASDVGAIKAKTDSLTFTVAGQVDANIQAVNDTAIQGTGAVGTDEWRAV